MDIEPRLEILCGPIASGKSTYCTLAATNHGKIIVNDDAIVSMLYGGEYAYKECLKPLYKSIEQHIITTALSLGRSVVIDRPNHKRNTRQRYIQIANMLDIKTRLIIFNRQDPKIHAKRRFTADSRGLTLDIWEIIAEIHQDVFETPTKEEGFFDIKYWDFETQMLFDSLN